MVLLRDSFAYLTFSRPFLTLSIVYARPNFHHAVSYLDGPHIIFLGRLGISILCISSREEGEEGDRSLT